MRASAQQCARVRKLGSYRIHVAAALIGARYVRHMLSYSEVFIVPPPPLCPSLTCADNRVNGTWACEEATALQELKQAMGFEGFVMSDWGATHSAAPAALAGLDQQMPDSSFFGAPLAAAIANGTVPMSRLDDMVMRMLTPMFALGLFANMPDPALRNTSSPARTPAHDALARRLAEGSITLLKNNGLLPISPEQLTGGVVAIFGDEQTVAGGGSGHVEAPYVITPAQGVAQYLNGPLPPAPTGVCTTEDGIDYYQDNSQSVTASESCLRAGLMRGVRRRVRAAAGRLTPHASYHPPPPPILHC